VQWSEYNPEIQKSIHSLQNRGGTYVHDGSVAYVHTDMHMISMIISTVEDSIVWGRYFILCIHLSYISKLFIYLISLWKLSTQDVSDKEIKKVVRQWMGFKADPEVHTTHPPPLLFFYHSPVLPLLIPFFPVPSCRLPFSTSWFYRYHSHHISPLNVFCIVGVLHRSVSA
jgi:hypothetical protein